MTDTTMTAQTGALSKVTRLFPGIAICLIIAAAAKFLSEHYGAPQMLFALLLGMALHFLMEDKACRPGIESGSKMILRTGVALLGLRITVDQVVGLGAAPILWVAGGVFLTIAFGAVMNKAMGRTWRFGILSGGSVGICGASAALAISSVMPKDDRLERNTIFAVLTVTTLSTIAMIVYPIICTALGLTDEQAGLFLGGTIHDVAQVVGAGYSLSESTGDISTITKLFRVALLVPVVFVLGVGFKMWAAKQENVEVDSGKLPVPFFVIGFCILVFLNTMGYVPDVVREPMIGASGWFLVTAIAALGIKTSLKSLVEVGFGPVALMILETAFIAIWVLLGIQFIL
ncbi:putative sulfate exporter family transporter [Terasakiella sp. A23]|uniref:YeiH family protein n=1 Tax=Terasakiella sp. FCG-A23 TaxID=3080561 RepID=UPI0029545C41|nr:putative sulfate exporter family transporter [Terasakiella sp. A23]MDV7341786.1 putative sulfate exporter family transporter [Terasakiella sp. A23]